MREKFSGSMITVAIAAAAAAISGAITRTSAQVPAPSATAPMPASALKTPWGEPDLQGIWTDESDTPLQRPAKYAAQEFFTAAQRAELDEARAAVLGRDRRAERGTENDVASGYNSAFWSWKRIGARTSLIADPPNGRTPPLTPEAQNMAAAEREFRLALLQATEACKTMSATCSGGKYDPTPSPRRAEPPPRYNTARIRLQCMIADLDPVMARDVHIGSPRLIGTTLVARIECRLAGCRKRDARALRPADGGLESKARSCSLFACLPRA